MSDRSELADILNRATYEDGLPTHDFDLLLCAADDILAAGYRKPRTVTTAAELDALHYGAAILDDCDAPAVCIRKQIDPPRTYWAMPHASSDAEFSADDILAIGPATVLHEGAAS